VAAHEAAREREVARLQRPAREDHGEQAAVRRQPQRNGVRLERRAWKRGFNRGLHIRKGFRYGLLEFNRGFKRVLGIQQGFGKVLEIHLGGAVPAVSSCSRSSTTSCDDTLQSRTCAGPLGTITVHLWISVPVGPLAFQLLRIRSHGLAPNGYSLGALARSRKL
jgi:hypothetical protein